MTQDSPDVTAARIEAERARARLMGTAQELQSRLSPKTLAHNAWEGAKVKGADLAEDAVDTVRRRPLAATGVVAAIAMYLAREPLKNLAGKLVGGGKKDDEIENSGSELKDTETVRWQTRNSTTTAARPMTAADEPTRSASAP